MLLRHYPAISRTQGWSGNFVRGNWLITSRAVSPDSLLWAEPGDLPMYGSEPLDMAVLEGVMVSTDSQLARFQRGQVG